MLDRSPSLFKIAIASPYYGLDFRRDFGLDSQLDPTYSPQGGSFIHICFRLCYLKNNSTHLKFFKKNIGIIYNSHSFFSFHCKFPCFSASHFLNNFFCCIIFIVILREQIIFQVAFVFRQFDN